MIEWLHLNLNKKGGSMKRTKLLIIVVVFVIFSLFSCSEKEVSTEERVFTLEELSTYDGKDGREAYIAVDGIVYDVTNVSKWKDGEHNKFKAGKDLTEEIKEISPHGISKLKNFTVVGRLKSE